MTPREALADALDRITEILIRRRDALFEQLLSEGVSYDDAREILIGQAEADAAALRQAERDLIDALRIV
jgi:hypothetical protein